MAKAVQLFGLTAYPGPPGPTASAFTVILAVLFANRFAVVAAPGPPLSMTKTGAVRGSTPVPSAGWKVVNSRAVVEYR